MNDNQTPAKLARLVRALQQHPVDSPVGRILANLLPEADEALAWLHHQERRAARPVVFAFDMPGYVMIGFEGDYQTIRDPELAGLSAAWEIFLHGANAPAVFFSRDRGLSPNSLGNALGLAAGWAGSYCPPLGVAIKAIKVRRADGAASFDPAYVPPMILNVFSACAAPLPTR